MAPIAIAFGVLELTGSASSAAIVIAAPTTAQIFLVLMGGTLADRTSRQKLMVGADVLAMAAQFCIALLFLAGEATVPVLALLMLIMGSAMAMHVPAATGFIPQLVKRGELQAANSLLALARNSSITLGAALAGMLVAFLGAGITLLIDAITFGVSALLIATIKPRAQEQIQEASFFADIKSGWREFTRHTWLWVIVVQFSLVVAAIEAIWALLGPAIAIEQLGGAVSWGFVSASMGIGTVLGGLIAMRLQVRRPMYFATLLVFFFSLLAITLSIPAEVWIICVAAFIGGVTGQIFGVLWYTTLQKEIPGHLLSRVSAYDHLGSIALAPLGIVVGGFLFEWLGGRSTLIIAALTIIIPTVFALMVPAVRNLKSDQPDQPSE